MNVIEKHLHEHFASLQDTEDIAPTSTGRAEMLGDSIPTTLEEPFAKVNSVVAGSPAESAGLKPGDQIRNFGYVNKGNHDGLKKVAECVQGNEGVCQNQPPSEIPNLTVDIAANFGEGISADRFESKARTASKSDSTTRLGR